MLFSKSKLQLIPDSEHIVLHGTPRDARCAVVSGRILLASKVPRAVTSLTVRFRPKQEDLLNPAMSISCLSEITCTVVKDGRLGPTSQELPYNPATMTHEWHFSIGIPGNISETVFSPSAFIAYELAAELRTASVVQWAPFCKLTCAVPIAVKRLPAADSALLAIANESVSVAAKWRDRVELTTIAGSRVVHDSRAFQVSGVVRPLLKGMRLLRAGFEVREFIDGPFESSSHTSSPSPRGSTVARCSRDVNAATLGMCQDSVHINMEFPPCSVQRRSGIVVDQEIQISGTLQIPKAYDDIQYDISIGPIKVSHELVFAVSIVDEVGQVHNVRLSSGIYAFPCVSSAIIDLPRYENSSKDTLLAAGQRWTLDSSTAERFEASSPWIAGAADNAGDRMFTLTSPPEYTPFLEPASLTPAYRRVAAHVRVFNMAT
ncbi:hypothetical protein LPJ53_005684 [Coemansia erecta]|uniref:Arrestin-like N-terminal domain-containing protein n=1 Tax=Coemansia erecta TaxID=147472 RepID=A0A9W8CPY6_9FUNG|nr:hypothetical protein LPJ53_005684 [Coemansia erecta]